MAVQAIDPSAFLDAVMAGHRDDHLAETTPATAETSEPARHVRAIPDLDEGTEPEDDDPARKGGQP